VDSPHDRITQNPAIMGEALYTGYAGNSHQAFRYDLRVKRRAHGRQRGYNKQDPKGPALRRAIMSIIALFDRKIILVLCLD
jgi:hypothetical protein